MKTCYAIVALALWYAQFARAAAIPFDFDTGAPLLFTGQTLPLNQTSGGMNAQFSSTGLGFSVQSDATTHFSLSQFSSNYLNPNGLNPGPLDILFSQPLSSITFAFATTDSHQTEGTTTIQLTAYMDSTGSPAIGSTT